mmetsp:Transcript_25385/g.61635  ORF Transcript_25385/g.61635 Transcript_25385/m.61635 type:complete len:268 (-) Transcript_25385:148-951(-)
MSDPSFLWSICPPAEYLPLVSSAGAVCGLFLALPVSCPALPSSFILSLSSFLVCCQNCISTFSLSLVFSDPWGSRFHSTVCAAWNSLAGVLSRSSVSVVCIPLLCTVGGRAKFLLESVIRRGSLPRSFSGSVSSRFWRTSDRILWSFSTRWKLPNLPQWYPVWKAGGSSSKASHITSAHTDPSSGFACTCWILPSLFLPRGSEWVISLTNLGARCERPTRMPFVGLIQGFPMRENSSCVILSPSGTVLPVKYSTMLATTPSSPPPRS